MRRQESDILIAIELMKIENISQAEAGKNVNAIMPLVQTKSKFKKKKFFDWFAICDIFNLKSFLFCINDLKPTTKMSSIAVRATLKAFN